MKVPYRFELPVDELVELVLDAAAAQAKQMPYDVSDFLFATMGHNGPGHQWLLASP